ncbi:hypothetical protein D3C84_1037380 [compost metagenome]
MTVVGSPVLAGALGGEDLGIRRSTGHAMLLATTHDELGIDFVIGGQGATVALYVGVTGCHVGADVTGCTLERAVNLARVFCS